MLKNLKQDTQGVASTSSQVKTEQTETFKNTDLWDNDIGYTQREWDRVVGYGKVPYEYSRIKVCPECKFELSEHDWCSHCKVRR